MAKKSKIDPLNPKPLGTEPKKPEGRKKPLDPVPMPGEEEIKLGFGDYLRIVNRLLTNQLAQIMGLEAPQAEGVKWTLIAIIVVAIIVIILRII